MEERIKLLIIATEYLACEAARRGLIAVDLERVKCILSAAEHKIKTTEKIG